MAKSLLEVLRDVSLDPTEQAAFSADPSAYLAQYGYQDVHPDDLSEAFSLVADTLPPDVAQTVTESQVAGQFGGGPADEGLAANSEPTFGAGYDAVDPGGGYGHGGEATFDGDTHFGEGVGDVGFGHGGDGADDAATPGGYDGAYASDEGPDTAGDYDGAFGTEAESGFESFDSEGDFDTGPADDAGFGDDVDDGFGADDIGSF